MKITELQNKYLVYNQLHLAYYTKKKYKRAMYSLIKAIGDVEIENVGRAECRLFQNYLAKNGLNATSITTDCKAVSPFFSLALEEGWISANPFFRLKKLRCAKTANPIYTPEQFWALYDTADTLIWKIRLLLGYTPCGLRRAEVLHLRICDLDFQHQIIKVQSRPEIEAVLGWNPKDKDSRIVPMTDELERLLTQRINEMPEEQPYLCLTEKKYGSILRKLAVGTVTDNLRLQVDSAFNKDFRKLSYSAATKYRNTLSPADIDFLRRGVFKYLRKNTASDLLDNGISITTVKEIMGHSDIKTTMESYYNNGRYSDMSRARKMGYSAI